MRRPLLALSKNSRYVTLFAVLGASILLLAVTMPLGWTLIWPGLTFAGMALAYNGHGHVVLAKSNGRVPWSRRLALLPFFVLVHGTWAVARRLSWEDRHHSITNDLVIGSRPEPADVPAGIATIVDLTAELDGAHSPNHIYASFPILDAAPLPPEALVEVATAIRSLPRPWLIHCAQGHGRSSMVASVVLLQEGYCDTVDQALELIARVRPAARPNSKQLAMLRRLEELRGEVG